MADLSPVKYRKLTPDKRLYSKSQTRLRNPSTGRGHTSTDDSERKLFSSSTLKPAESFKSVLGLLRNRHEASKQSKATPEVAASIIKDYILPMFEADCSQKMLAKRSADKGIRRKFQVSDGSSGTLYGDMKLSDKLVEQITILKNQNENLTQRLNDQTQCKEAYKLESERLHAEVLCLQAKLQISLNRLDEMQERQQMHELNNDKVEHEMSEFKKLYKSNEAKNMKLKNEYIIALGRLESAEYSNLLTTQELDILKTQFEMIAHNMQQLNKLMNEFAMVRLGDEKGFYEKKMLLGDFNKYMHMTDFLAKEYEQIYTLRKAEQLSLSLLDGAISDISVQREKAIKFLIKKNEKLSKFCDKFNKENTLLKEKVNETAKRYESLSLEFKKLWKKHASTLKSTLSNYDKCKRCDKLFLEDDNFNWSCRVHTSSYEAFWLCCGKKQMDALGCLTGKHLPMNEIEKLGLVVEVDGVIEEKCVSCKEIGHTTLTCPRDPNRLFQAIEPFKSDKVPRNTSLTADSLKILKEKLGLKTMTLDIMSSPSNSSQSSENDTHNRDQMSANIREKLKDTMKIRNALGSIAMKRKTYSLQIYDFSEGEKLESTQTFS